MSVHRYWFSGTETVGVSPAYDAGWTNVAGAARRALHAAPGGENNTTIQMSSAAGAERLSRQYVGPVPRSGVLSGSFTFVMGFAESVAADTAYAQVRIHVFSADGLTKRGTLFAGTASGTDFTQSTSAWYTRVVSGSLAPQTAQIGDLLVVEVGARVVGTPAGTFSHHVRSNSASTDVASSPENIQVSSSNPWIELTIPDITPPRGRAVAVGAEALVDGARVRASREHVDALVDGQRARVSQAQLEALVDGRRAQTARTYVEALVLPRTPLRTVAGNLVYRMRGDGLWEAIWVP